MAKVMSYNDKFGNTYTGSYWRIAQVNVGVADQTARIVFYGYKDAEARVDSKLPIGDKTYTVPSADFAVMYAAHIAPGGPNLMTLAYQYAMNTKDVSNNNVMESFFEHATDG